MPAATALQKRTPGFNPGAFYKPAVPAALGWDSTTWPISGTVAYVPGGRNVASLTITPQSIFDARSTARTAPGATFYVSGSGVDTNAGTSSAPFRSISKAVVAANAAGVPTKIVIAYGYYPRQYNPWYNGGTGVTPTVDLAFVVMDSTFTNVVGRVLTGTQESTYTFTRDTTLTNAFVAGTTAAPTSVSNVNRICDVIDANRFGNYTELVNVSTAALCNATPNSWTLVGTTLYVNRRDQATPSLGTNTRLFRASTSSLVFRTPVNVYMENLDVEGGNNLGCIDALMPSGTTGKYALVANNCSFKYGGGVVDSTAARSVAIDSWQGIAAFFNCAADAGWTDNWNFHNSNSLAMYALTVNCTGVDAGRPGSTSNNNWTSHETVVGIDIAGHYDTARGGAWRSINNSKTLFSGSVVRNDQGDRNITPSGGSIFPTAVRVDDTAEYWLDQVRVDMPGGTYAYFAGTAATSKIHRRNCWPVPAPDSGPGIFDTW